MQIVGEQMGKIISEENPDWKTVIGSSIQFLFQSGHGDLLDTTLLPVCTALSLLDHFYHCICDCIHSSYITTLSESTLFSLVTWGTTTSKTTPSTTSLIPIPTPTSIPSLDSLDTLISTLTISADRDRLISLYYDRGLYRSMLSLMLRGSTQDILPALGMLLSKTLHHPVPRESAEWGYLLSIVSTALRKDETNSRDCVVLEKCEQYCWAGLDAERVGEGVRQWVEDKDVIDRMEGVDWIDTAILCGNTRVEYTGRGHQLSTLIRGDASRRTTLDAISWTLANSANFHSQLTPCLDTLCALHLSTLSSALTVIDLDRLDGLSREIEGMDRTYGEILILEGKYKEGMGRVGDREVEERAREWRERIEGTDGWEEYKRALIGESERIVRVSKQPISSLFRVDGLFAGIEREVVRKLSGDVQAKVMEIVYNRYIKDSAFMEEVFSVFCERHRQEARKIEEMRVIGTDRLIEIAMDKRNLWAAWREMVRTGQRDKALELSKRIATEDILPYTNSVIPPIDYSFKLHEYTTLLTTLFHSALESNATPYLDQLTLYTLSLPFHPLSLSTLYPTLSPTLQSTLLSTHPSSLPAHRLMLSIHSWQCTSIEGIYAHEIMDNRYALVREGRQGYRIRPVCALCRQRVGRVGNGGILISGLNGENRVIGVRVEDRYCGQGIGEAMRDIEMMGEWRDHNERMDKADEETEYRDERIYRLLD